MRFSKTLIVFSACLFVFGIAYGILALFKLYYQPLFNFEKKENNHGVFKEYYVSGKLKSSEEYFKGLKTGKCIYLNLEGDTLESFEFYMGERHGESKYFTNSGDFVLLEIYDFGKLIYRKIKNDSLYTFEYKAFDTGLNCFEQACAECHSSNEEIVNFKDTILTISKLDTIHLCIIDTLENPLIKRNYFKLNSNELDAIKYFIHELKDSKNEQKQQIRINRNQKKRIVKGEIKNIFPHIYK